MSSVFSRGLVWRFMAYLALWLVLIGFNTANLVVGAVAAACAVGVSLSLLPVTDRRLSPAALMRFALLLPWQSLVAGIDVARRALDPQLPLQTGFITYRCGLADGFERNAFLSFLSLQPGTLPVSVEKGGELLIHCLDTSQPVAAQLAAEESMFAQATGAA